MTRIIPPGNRAVCIVALLLILFLMSSCGGNGSSSSRVSPGQEEPSTSLEINSVTGGEISVTDESGIKATLLLPPGSLPEDSFVSMEMTVTDAEIIINTTPKNFKLFNAASLTLDFGVKKDDYDGFRLFDEDNNSMLRPLKQIKAKATVTGSVYMLGDFCSLVPDQALLSEIAANGKNSSPTSEWQELITTFNGLMWACSYYSGSGDSEKAAECMNSAINQCKNGAAAFLDRDSISETKATINALEKLKYLMNLCDNPDNTLETINSKLDELDS